MYIIAAFVLGFITGVASMFVVGVLSFKMRWI